MKNRDFWFREISKFCFSIILLLVVMILLKSKPELKAKFYTKVYENNISFSSINTLYQKYAGESLPFENLFVKEEKTVFNEQLNYKEANKYKDGVKLTVTSDYLVPALSDGLVIFIGEKEGYGNTIIVQQSNGIDVWYSNLSSITVSLYDYVDSGMLMGEVTDEFFYLVFKKDGEIVDYQDYI